MTDHLSPLQLKKLAVSALPEDELTAAAVHTAQCQSCHDQFVEELRRQRASSPFTLNLEPEFWFRDAHVDFDLLVALADKTVDEETKEIVDIHLQSCETCREDVRSFLALRESTAAEPAVSHARPNLESSHEVGAAPWWQQLSSRRVYAVAAIVLLGVALLVGLAALHRSSSPPFEANKHEQRTPGNGQSPDLSPSPAPNASSSPATGADNAQVAILKDRSGEITIEKNGRVTGLDEASESSRMYIARAAISERIEPAEVLKDLGGEQSGLRGTGDGPQEFKQLYPVRNVVVENRPVFSWDSLPEASNYQVYVLDADGKQIRQSEELPSTQTQWQAPAALRRGQVFSWVVTALVDGKKVVSPVASAPETKFAVLSNSDFQELARLRKSRSHLALGVFYARAGLLNEAEREFESLVKLNPDSELPRKLLQSVRNTRKLN